MTDHMRDGTSSAIVTTDAAVPQAVVDQIVSLDGFVAGRAVALG